jgi:mannose-6-phosphate isomerase-like protein (cupin superfamily)
MSEFIPNDQMKFVPKSWGYELWIVNNDLYCGKILFVKKGQWLSYHYHRIKDEVLYVWSGRARFVVGTDETGENRKEYLVHPGEAFHVTVNNPHQIEALEDLTIVEFSTQHFDSDSHRISPSKGEGGPRIMARHPWEALFDGKPNCVPESAYGAKF